MYTFKERFNELDQQQILRVKEVLECLGMLSPYMGGIQMDIMVQGPIQNSLASATDILFAISSAVEGLKLFNKDFTHVFIDQIAEMANLSREEVAAFISNLMQDKIVFNIVGVNPEMHPQINQIIEGARQLGLDVNLTTSAGMLMVNGNEFTDNFLNNPTDITLNGDDFESVRQIQNLYDILDDPEVFKQVWLTVKSERKRRALQNIYAAYVLDKRNQELPPELRTKIKFDITFDSYNLDYIYSLTNTLATLFPTSEVDLFPGQTAYYNEYTVFKIEDLERLECLVDRMIVATLNNECGIVKKLHYWMLLKAAFNLYRENPKRMINFLSGFGSWTCYSNVPGASRYLQIGGNANVVENSYSGGYLNCTLNDSTVGGDMHQVDSLTPRQISTHITNGMHKNAETSINTCKGCMIPSLTALDELTLVAGMNPELQSEYVRLRNSILKSE